MKNNLNIIEENDLVWTQQSYGKKFSLRRKSLSAATQGEKLGCSLYEVPPGKWAWPYHYHTANEGAIYPLEGKGTFRINGEEIEISKGDYITCTAGRMPHQIVNSSENILKYLCFSTMIDPEVIVYPDSNKIGILVG